MLPPSIREDSRGNGSDDGGDWEAEETDADGRGGRRACDGGLLARVGEDLGARLGHGSNVRRG